jgi:hypothetical protein
MRELALLLCAFITLVGRSAPAQETRTALSPQTRELTQIKLDIQDAVRRLEKDNPSASFARLTSPGAAEEFQLSPEQRHSIGLLDELTRAIVRDWIIRGLDDTGPQELVERLGERGIRIRRDIVAHAEAIASHGILSADQVGRLRSNANPPKSLKSMTKVDGTTNKQRSLSKRSAGMVPSKEELAKLKSAIHQQITTMYALNDHVSDYFSSLTLKDAPEELGLSSEQSRLLGQLDHFTRDIIRGWLLRGLDAAEPPPDLAERVSERGMQHTNRIIAQAETMAMVGILTKVQVEKSKRRLWRCLGSRALLDPELASRLRLTPEQMDEIAIRIANKRRTTEAADTTLGPYRSLVVTDRVLARQADAEIRRRINEADGLIWDVLAPFQENKLEELLMAKPRPGRRRR